MEVLAQSTFSTVNQLRKIRNRNSKVLLINLTQK